MGCASVGATAAAVVAAAGAPTAGLGGAGAQTRGAGDAAACGWFVKVSGREKAEKSLGELCRRVMVEMQGQAPVAGLSK